MLQLSPNAPSTAMARPRSATGLFLPLALVRVAALRTCDPGSPQGWPVSRFRVGARLGFQLRAYFAARVRRAVNIHVEIAFLETLELIIREC